MLEYARWKYILVAVVLALALLFALPNVFGDDPALQVARKDHAPITTDVSHEVEAFLKERNVPYVKSYIDNDRLICYSKESDDKLNLIIVVVNLDPHYTHSGFVDLPLERLNIDPAHPFQAHDLLTGSRYVWNGSRNFVELNPASVPAHVLRIRRRLRSETDFEYFL